MGELLNVTANYIRSISSWSQPVQMSSCVAVTVQLCMQHATTQLCLSPRQELVPFSTQRYGNGGKLVHWEEYQRADCLGTRESQPRLMQSFCRAWPLLFLTVDRQSGIGVESQQTPVRTSLLFSGPICYPRGSWNSKKLWVTLHSVLKKKKINMREQFPSRSLLLPIPLLNATPPPCCSLPAASLGDHA